MKFIVLILFLTVTISCSNVPSFERVESDIRVFILPQVRGADSFMLHGRYSTLDDGSLAVYGAKVYFERDSTNEIVLTYKKETKSGEWVIENWK